MLSQNEMSIETQKIDTLLSTQKIIIGNQNDIIQYLQQEKDKKITVT